MSINWDTQATRRSDVIFPTAEQRRRDSIAAIANGLAALKNGESLKVEAHEDGKWTVTFTTKDAAL